MSWPEALNLEIVQGDETSLNGQSSPGIFRDRVGIDRLFPIIIPMIDYNYLEVKKLLLLNE